MKKFLTAFFVFALFVISSCGDTRMVVGAQLSTPVYVRPDAPGPGYLWMEGDWIFSNGHYVWRQGHWARPRGHRTWNEGHWSPRGKGWYWERGRWR